LLLEKAMSRIVGAALAAGFALLVLAWPASAQYLPPYTYNRPTYGGGYHPPLSPWLNLANGGDPAIQYYLRTLPEFDRRATTNIYNAAITNLEDRALQPPAVAPADVDIFTPLPGTGHPTAFQNTNGYFPATPLRPAAGRAPAPIRR
jgi:hypothetical protein